MIIAYICAVKNQENVLCFSTDDPTRYPWCQLISRMVEICGADSESDVISFVRQLSVDSSISEEVG